MYFFSVISALSEAQLSADPHTTRYNTDDLQVTPTIYEATYRPNLIMRKGIYLRRFSGQKPLSTSNHNSPILTTDVMKFQRLAALTCFVAAGILISSCDKETPRQEQKPAQPTTPVVQPEEPAAPDEARVAVAEPGGLEAALKGQDLEQLTKLTVRSGALNQADFAALLDGKTAADFQNNQIYPDIWGDEKAFAETRAELAQRFKELAAFYQAAAEQHCGVVVRIS